MGLGCKAPRVSNIGTLMEAQRFVLRSGQLLYHQGRTLCAILKTGVVDIRAVLDVV
jgi:hypothetical protein